jgi:hypothetical protein
LNGRVGEFNRVALQLYYPAADLKISRSAGDFDATAGDDQMGLKTGGYLQWRVGCAVSRCVQLLPERYQVSSTEQHTVGGIE